MLKAVVIDADRLLIEGTFLDPLLDRRGLREELETRASWRSRESGKSDLACLVDEVEEELDGKLFGLKLEEFALAAETVNERIRPGACQFLNHIGEVCEDHVLYFLTETPCDILDNTRLYNSANITLGVTPCNAGNIVTGFRGFHSSKDHIERLVRSHDEVLVIASECNDQLLMHAHDAGMQTYKVHIMPKDEREAEHINLSSGLNYSFQGPMALAMQTFLGPYVVY